MPDRPQGFNGLADESFQAIDFRFHAYDQELAQVHTGLRSVCAAFAQRLHSVCAVFAQRLRSICALFAQRLRNVSALLRTVSAEFANVPKCLRMVCAKSAQSLRCGRTLLGL